MAKKIISPAQCRAARAMLGWTRTDLANKSGVSPGTLAGFEGGSREPYGRTLADVIAALEGAGIEFIGGDRPGVRMREKTRRSD